MILARNTLRNLNTEKVLVPDQALISLPEKVIQFGTGVLLRALPDYFIDKANRCGIFNGRIVIIKSTDGGDAGSFGRQDSLYTLCMRGIEAGRLIEENVVCASVSRVLSASADWAAVLQCAHDAAITVVISNTTEVGIELVKESIYGNPPSSYPAKLLALLYERYTAFKGSPQRGLVIIPTELISDNGNKLKAVVHELARWNELDKNFIEWLNSYNHFCNSLVDRIVPGKPKAAAKIALELDLGYEDDLMIMSEVYGLWAIEGDDQVKTVLSFSAADTGVVIAGDINIFKELKLRLLNGTHTLSSGVAFLAGIATVKEAMENKAIHQFIQQLMTKEIAGSIPYPVDGKDAAAFAAKVLDRFSNPSIEHQWLSITLNYTAKLKSRVVPVLQRYYEQHTTVPENIATGFAAWLLFMKAVKREGNVYVGEFNGQPYPVNDEMAAYFFDLWQHLPVDDLVKTVLSNTRLWDADLSLLEGFAANVTGKVQLILKNGMMALIDS